MGLDMYLFKINKQPNKELNDILSLQEKLNECKLTVEKMKENKDFADSLQYLHKKLIGNFSHYTFFEEIVYWRKSNAIHHWFVENVQDGEDDCDYYKVHLSDLEDLLDTLKTVQDSIKNKPLVDQVFQDCNGEPYTEKTFLTQDLTVAESLLPTQKGFFFGNTRYGKDYLDDIEFTIEKVKDLIDNFDFDNNYLIYNSSW